MRKRKTSKTMELDERLAVRREMVRQAERILRENYPAMGPGAIRIKAHKFVEDSLAKEIKAWQN